MDHKTIGTSILALLLVGNLAFSVFTFINQSRSRGDLEAELARLKGRVSSTERSLGETTEKISDSEGEALERRNSIRITNAVVGKDALEITYKLGSDISSVTSVFQDWGDHSQTPEVEEIDFEVRGRALTFTFSPVLNPKDATAVIVVQANSISVADGVQVETIYKDSEKKLSQYGAYTKEPL